MEEVNFSIKREGQRNDESQKERVSEINQLKNTVGIL